MVSLVERATSSSLIGPDLAINVEICDACNHDPVLAKEVVKGIKKRLRSKNPKAQLLSLILLETIVKDCSDVVHTLVAEKELPYVMVKIAKKKSDFCVTEKISNLINSWQEAFGGPRARYPQFFAAYQELLRLGVILPPTPEKSAPVSAPPQRHLQSPCDPESIPVVAESSSDSEYPTLSLTEIQKGRDALDALSKMLISSDQGNREEVKEVLDDLIEKCRSYKHRLVHLVNSSTDETLMHQGLALNDDLQHVLAKHESLSSSAAQSPLVDIDECCSLTAAASPALTADHQSIIDLLSGDGFDSEAQPPASSPIALLDMIPHHDDDNKALSLAAPSPIPLLDMVPHHDDEARSLAASSPIPLLDMVPHHDDEARSLAASSPIPLLDMVPHHDDVNETQSSNVEHGCSHPYAWSKVESTCLHPNAWVIGDESNNALPPPPWETEEKPYMVDSAIHVSPQTMQSETYIYHHHPQIYYHQSMHGYEYGEADRQPLSADDKLFGDLVQISKFKHSKSMPSGMESRM